MRNEGAREASYDMERTEDRIGSGDRRRTRSRSRSPRRRPVAADFYRARSPEHADRHHHSHQQHDGRLRKPRRDHHHHHRRHHRHHSSELREQAPAKLPFNGRRLSYKHDLEAFEPLFAYYLDIQKGKDFYELDSHEARGRWKSFVHKWNRAELAEGWYDPEMFERVVREAPARTKRSDINGGDTRGDDEEEEEDEAPREMGELRGSITPGSGHNNEQVEDEDEDDEDDYLPPLPPGQSGARPGTSRHGPGIPNVGDLTLQREAAAEARESRIADLRLARKADRAEQKERLDDLVPRAEPGTRERKLEKKALVNDKMRSFREKGDAMEEVGDGELMGGGDSLDEYKKVAKEQQRKKTDRELRREAEARAKAEEREERLREWREREEEKLRGLKELARARFG
ncbi:hypothetical protein VM1G_09066 [Cytospora mali]|uniref:Uncharacterized protein n=1 Tax=Cytospora mali TaxID=578113 RepID=A0A194WAQ3_CYTMA|nr:hypothetical protein VM1G_09066 [Valsa mali]